MPRSAGENDLPKPLDQHRRQAIAQAFADSLNLEPAQLRGWLETPQSQSVGFVRRGESESVGYRAGRRILSILARHRTEWDDDDYRHMRKVVGFIKRHLAQRPSGDVTHTRWRHSLMNWGHDPLLDRRDD